MPEAFRMEYRCFRGNYIVLRFTAGALPRIE